MKGNSTPIFSDVICAGHSLKMLKLYCLSLIAGFTFVEIEEPNKNPDPPKERSNDDVKILRPGYEVSRAN